MKDRPNEMLFNKFDHLMCALNEYRDNPGPHSGITLIAGQMMLDSQRFYLPDAAYILQGKVIDEQMKRMMRLPFDNVALLTETHFRETGETSWKVTLAASLDGNSHTSRFFTGLLDLKFQGEVVDPGWCICSFVLDKQFEAKHPLTRGWCPMPFAFAYITMPRDGVGFHSRIVPVIDTGMSIEQLRQEFNEDICAVQNLCAMLALKNVKTKTIEPPIKLNKKRIKKGKSPLFSYHVLEVNGEVWDKESVARCGNSGRGVRSHYRRGHVRHLSPDRSVFVRDTIVRGAIPGFVDKDYRVDV